LVHGLLLCFLLFFVVVFSFLALLPLAAARPPIMEQE
jgi:hypothetical protein